MLGCGKTTVSRLRTLAFSCEAARVMSEAHSMVRGFDCCNGVSGLTSHETRDRTRELIDGYLRGAWPKCSGETQRRKGPSSSSPAFLRAFRMRDDKKE